MTEGVKGGGRGGTSGALPGIDLSVQAQAASPLAPPVPLPDEDAICTIFLTSGSTGQPKGVMVSQRATWLRTHAGAAAYATTGGAGEVIMFPLFHMAGWNFAMMAWSARHAAHLVSRADAEQLLGAVARWSPSVIYCIPAVWRRILESDLAVDTSSVEWALTGTSQVTQELLAGIKERFPAGRGRRSTTDPPRRPGRWGCGTPTCSPTRAASAIPSPACRPRWPRTASSCSRATA